MGCWLQYWSWCTSAVGCPGRSREEKYWHSGLSSPGGRPCEECDWGEGIHPQGIQQVIFVAPTVWEVVYDLQRLALGIWACKQHLHWDDLSAICNKEPEQSDCACNWKEQPAIYHFWKSIVSGMMWVALQDHPFIKAIISAQGTGWPPFSCPSQGGRAGKYHARGHWSSEGGREDPRPAGISAEVSLSMPPSPTFFYALLPSSLPLAVTLVSRTWSRSGIIIDMTISRLFICKHYCALVPPNMCNVGCATRTDYTQPSYRPQWEWNLWLWATTEISRHHIVLLAISQGSAQIIPFEKTCSAALFSCLDRGSLLLAAPKWIWKGRHTSIRVTCLISRLKSTRQNLSCEAWRLMLNVSMLVPLSWSSRQSMPEQQPLRSLPCFTTTGMPFCPHLQKEAISPLRKFL